LFAPRNVHNLLEVLATQQVAVKQAVCSRLEVSMRLPKGARIVRDNRIWELSTLGYTQREIGAEVGLSHRGVGKIQRKIEALELLRQADTMERRKIQQDAAIRRVWKEGFAAWFRSLAPRSRAIRRENGDGDDVVSSESTEQNGNPQHLQIVLQALRDLRALWGLDVLPATQEMSTVAGIAMAAKIQERAAAYVARTANGGGFLPGATTRPPAPPPDPATPPVGP
jgi:hypothetical protein